MQSRRRTQALVLFMLAVLPQATPALCIEHRPEGAMACDHGQGPEHSVASSVAGSHCDAVFCARPAALRLAEPGLQAVETPAATPRLPAESGPAGRSTAPLTPPPKA